MWVTGFWFQIHILHAKIFKDILRVCFILTVREDLVMAQRNTKTALEAIYKKVNECGEYGDSSIKNLIQLNVEEEKVYCYAAIEKTREINKFIILYVIYKRHLKHLIEIYEKTEYLISVGIGKLKCVMEKIHDVLKFRTAIQSEIVFVSCVCKILIISTFVF